MSFVIQLVPDSDRLRGKATVLVLLETTKHPIWRSGPRSLMMAESRRSSWGWHDLPPPREPLWACRGSFSTVPPAPVDHFTACSAAARQVPWRSHRARGHRLPGVHARAGMRRPTLLANWPRCCRTTLEGATCTSRPSGSGAAGGSHGSRSVGHSRRTWTSTRLLPCATRTRWGCYRTAWSPWSVPGCPSRPSLSPPAAV